jgi:hypothetical protein
MTESKTYGGGCHCGNVRYEATTDLGKVLACNCSICSKKGHLLTFVPEDAFKLLAGEGEQQEYRFHTKKLAHLFCKTCGIASFATGAGPDGKKMVAINVRCLDGVDVGSLTVTSFDGKSR